ncbi:MAG: acyltransferase 3 [Acidobacteriaceae bacterium]|nr:acyltransferase 3 [Acidobacteriaceae bacterium]
MHTNVPTAMHESTRGEVRPERIAWIDVARGIGILLVVLGHLESGLPSRIIYAFHMPFFFFLSGYVHKIQGDYAGFFRKRCIHLLVPYVAFLLLLAPLELHRASHAGSGAIQKTITDMIWGGDRLHGDYGVFWFITCLFATQQIANWLLSKCKPGTIAVWATISMALAYVNSVLFPRFTLPLDLNVVVAALPFYLAGYYAKKAELDRWWVTLAATLGVVATVWLAYANVPIQYDMRSAIYGVPVLSLLLAACCIVAMIRVSKLILLAPAITSMFEKIGAASMGIMFIHKPLPGFPGFGRLSIFHPLTAFVVVSFIAYVCTVFISRFSLTRAILLGSQKDFLALRHRNRELQSPKVE